MDSPPTAIPWYKADVIRGLLAILVSQLMARIAAQYHINFALFGLNADVVVQWIMDGLSTVALGYTAHARAAKPLPQLTLTQTSANKANAPLVEPPQEKPQ